MNFDKFVSEYLLAPQQVNFCFFCAIKVPLHIHETLWCIFSMFIGVMITTLTIANLQLLVTNLDASRLEFQRKIEMVKKFMHYRKLPTYLQDRILAYYDYQWTVLKGADEQKVGDSFDNLLLFW